MKYYISRIRTVQRNYIQGELTFIDEWQESPFNRPSWLGLRQIVCTNTCMRFDGIEDHLIVHKPVIYAPGDSLEMDVFKDTRFKNSAFYHPLRRFPDRLCGRCVVLRRSLRSIVREVEHEISFGKYLDYY